MPTWWNGMEWRSESHEYCIRVSLVNLKSLLKRLQSSLKSVRRSSEATWSLLWGKNHNQKSWHFRSLRSCCFQWNLPVDTRKMLSVHKLFPSAKSIVGGIRWQGGNWVCLQCRFNQQNFTSSDLLEQQSHGSGASSFFCASSSSMISSKSWSRCVHDWTLRPS